MGSACAKGETIEYSEKLVSDSEYQFSNEPCMADHFSIQMDSFSISTNCLNTKRSSLTRGCKSVVVTQIRMELNDPKLSYLAKNNSVLHLPVLRLLNMDVKFQLPELLPLNLWCGTETIYSFIYPDTSDSSSVTLTGKVGVKPISMQQQVRKGHVLTAEELTQFTKQIETELSRCEKNNHRGVKGNSGSSGSYKNATSKTSKVEPPYTGLAYKDDSSESDSAAARQRTAREKSKKIRRKDTPSPQCMTQRQSSKDAKSKLFKQQLDGTLLEGESESLSSEDDQEKVQNSRPTSLQLGLDAPRDRKKKWSIGEKLSNQTCVGDVHSTTDLCPLKVSSTRCGGQDAGSDADDEDENVAKHNRKRRNVRTSEGQGIEKVASRDGSVNTTDAAEQVDMCSKHAGVRIGSENITDESIFKVDNASQDTLSSGRASVEKKSSQREDKHKEKRKSVDSLSKNDSSGSYIGTKSSPSKHSISQEVRKLTLRVKYTTGTDLKMESGYRDHRVDSSVSDEHDTLTETDRKTTEKSLHEKEKEVSATKHVREFQSREQNKENENIYMDVKEDIGHTDRRVTRSSTMSMAENPWKSCRQRKKASLGTTTSTSPPAVEERPSPVQAFVEAKD